MDEVKRGVATGLPDRHSSESDDRFQEPNPSPLTRRSFGEMFMQIESTNTGLASPAWALYLNALRAS
ncbi:hypothetical protein TNCV_5136081 [Trichonephila clavipes]|nr:hypothetical protein TNCV_5136081 [Trichonephila clavipes]